MADGRLKWIADNADKLKETATVCDFCRRYGILDDTYKKADRMLHDLAFSFLMVAMGEHLPKTLWSVDDYSVLYGVLREAEEEEKLVISFKE